MSSRTIIGFLLLLAAPCPAQSVRDSAGVRIVEYAWRDRAPKKWRVDPKPLLEIGGEGRPGSVEFSNIVGVARLSDGRVAVGNAASFEIMTFDARGRFIRALGRRGRGPGEFTSLWGMDRRGDTIMGIDAQLLAHVFAPDGRLVRSISRPRIDGFTIGEWLGWLPTGVGAYLVNVAPGDPPRGRSTQLVALALIAPDGAVRVLPGRYGGWEQYREGSQGARPITFSPAAHGAVTSRGIWVGYSATYEMTHIDSSGRVTVRIRRDVVREPVDADDRARYADLVTDASRSIPEPMRARLIEQEKRSPIATEHPAFSAIVASQLDEIWVNGSRRGFQIGMRRHVPHVRSTWSVFDPAGAWLADVELPALFLPFDIGVDYVAGISRDAYDVERVTVLRLRR